VEASAWSDHPTAVSHDAAPKDRGVELNAQMVSYTGRSSAMTAPRATVSNRDHLAIQFGLLNGHVAFGSARQPGGVDFSLGSLL
jgi:hypothetical protein